MITTIINELAHRSMEMMIKSSNSWEAIDFESFLANC